MLNIQIRNITRKTFSNVFGDIDLENWKEKYVKGEEKQWEWKKENCSLWFRLIALGGLT